MRLSHYLIQVKNFMVNRSNTKQNSRRRRFSRAQSMVEFALISPLAIVMLLVGVQYALIGAAAVAVNQGTSALARYASENPGTVGGATGNGAVALTPSMMALLSPTICPNNTSCPGLTVNIVSYQGNTTTVTDTPQFGDRCVISFSYATTSKLALPNPFLAVPPIFPGITFPSAVGASDTQLYQ